MIFTSYFLCLLAYIVKPTTQMHKMTKRFAKKSASHSKFLEWFQPNSMVNTWSKKNSFFQMPFRTERFYNSHIPYWSRLLNEDDT